MVAPSRDRFAAINHKYEVYECNANESNLCESANED